jgi:hypothetical protein
MSFWTEARIETLKELWLSLSASKIAAKIGDGATRNMVIGKVDRLGLPSKPAGRPSEPRKIKPPRPPVVAKQVQELPRKSSLAVPAPLSIPFEWLQQCSCRWPLWPEQDGYCGHTKSESHPSYCEHHVRRSVGR